MRLAKLLYGNHYWANVNISPTALAIVLAMSEWIIKISHEQQQVSIRETKH